MMEERERREREKEEFKRAQELESLRRAFKRLDKSNDGQIDCDELLAEVRRTCATCACAKRTRQRNLPREHRRAET